MWYLMKAKPQWTYEYMVRDEQYYHESLKNNLDENSSTGFAIKEEEDEDVTSDVIDEESCGAEQENVIEEEEDESIVCGEYSLGITPSLNEQLKFSSILKLLPYFP